MFFFPGDLLLIPAFLFSLWAQFKVKSAYAKYSQIGTRAGLSGAEVAARILRDSNIELARGDQHPEGSCGLESIEGELSDHYDPRDRTLRLSEPVYHGRSIAALGIAAHEVGHAIQHARLYAPLSLRNIIYPVTSIASTLSWPLFFVGLLLPPVDNMARAFTGGVSLLWVGVALFSLAVFFTLLTLPVEFNASRRALKALASGGYLQEDELHGARAVLTAAALTYVAAAAMALMQLLRMILLARSRD